MNATETQFDYVKIAETIRPIYQLNDWQITAVPGSSALAIPTVSRLADIIHWAYETCRESELDETYASTARIRVSKSANSFGSHDYRLSLEIDTLYSA